MTRPHRSSKRSPRRTNAVTDRRRRRRPLREGWTIQVARTTELAALKRKSGGNEKTITTLVPMISMRPSKKRELRGFFSKPSHFSPYLLRGRLGAFPKNGSRCGRFPCQNSPGGQGSSRVVSARRVPRPPGEQETFRNGGEGRAGQHVLPPQILSCAARSASSKSWNSVRAATGTRIVRVWKRHIAGVLPPKAGPFASRWLVECQDPHPAFGAATFSLVPAVPARDDPQLSSYPLAVDGRRKPVGPASVALKRYG
jgi:hypothetical protein